MHRESSAFRPYRRGKFRSAGLAIVASAAVVAPVLVVAGPASAAPTAAGLTWVQQTSTANPPAGYLGAMAYDAATGQTILFGGSSGGGVVLDQTWAFSAGQWTQLDPETGPAGLVGASMVYDAATGQLVLFGGQSGGSPTPSNETWTWDGTNWTHQNPATSPPARDVASMAYDAKTGTVVLFGGSSGGGLPVLNDTWTWDGTNWTQQDPATSPPLDATAAMDYDAALGEVVLFGGAITDDPAGSNETWTWDGTNWTQQTPTVSPPAVSFGSGAYDPETGLFEIFGGQDTTGSLQNETWAYNGTTWTLADPAVSPPVRQVAPMAYDQADNEMVVFGGLDSASSPLGDTWAMPDVAQTVAFTSSVPSAPKVGGTYTATAAATSNPAGAPVTLSTTTPAVCSINGSTVTFLTAGTCTLDADQASSVGFIAGHAVQTFQVPSGVAPTVAGITPASGVPAGGNTVTVEGTALTDATVTFGGVPGTDVDVNPAGTSLSVTVPAGTDGATVPVVVTTPDGTATSPIPYTYIQPGYWETSADGAVFSFGGARFYGSMADKPLNQPIVGMAETPDHKGYWLFAADGGVFTFGDARFYGSVPGVLAPGQTLNAPIVAVEATPDGKGYRMFAADGGVFDFGDAAYDGSLPGLGVTPNKPIVAATSTPIGQGYLLTAGDGGVFAFGNATFHGSLGATAASGTVNMAETPSGNGYWLFNANGTVSDFGDAHNFGDASTENLAAPIVFGAATTTSNGYWLFAKDGGVFTYGDAPYLGSLPGENVTPNTPIEGGVGF